MPYYRANTFPPPRPITRGVRVLNYPLLLVTVALVAILAATTHLIHKRQAAAQAKNLLELAAAEREAWNWELVAQILGRYHRLRPDDVDAWEELADARTEAAKTDRELAVAIQTHLDVVQADPGRVERWRRAAELQLSRDAPREALESIGKYLDARPGDSRALRIRAQAGDRLYARGEKFPVENVIKGYEAVLESNPEDIEAAIRLAQLLCRYEDELRRAGYVGEEESLAERASALLDTMVAKSQRPAAAHFARYRGRKLIGVSPAADSAKVAGLDPDLTRARELDPSDPEIAVALASELLAAALAAETSGQAALAAEGNGPPVRSVAQMLDQALECARAALAIDPDDPRAYRALADVQAAKGDLAAAVAAIEDGLRQVGPQSDLLNARLCELFMEQGKWDDAENVLRRIGAAREPTGAFRREEWIDPATVTALVHLLWGTWYLGASNPAMDFHLAAAEFEKASKQKVNPRLAATIWRRLGECRFALGEWDRAAKAEQEAVFAAPANVESWLALAECERRLGEWDSALGHYRQALSLVEPESAAAIRTVMAQVELSRQLALPMAERRWSQFEEDLAEANLASPASCGPFLVALEAEAWREAEVNFDWAGSRSWIIERIARHEEFFGAQPEFWRSALAWYALLGDFPAARRALGCLEGVVGNKAYLERAWLAVVEGGLAAAQPILAEAREQLPPGWFSAMAVSLARRFQGQPEAVAVTRGLAVIDPDNIGLHALAVEQSVVAGDPAPLRQAEGQLRRLEGEAGPYLLWAQVHSLLFEALAGTRERVFWARDAARKLFALRPTWDRSLFALGLVAETEGRPEEALSHYADAQKANTRDDQSLARQVILLALRDRPEEARAVLRALPEARRMTPQLLPIAVRLEVAAQDTGTAIELAQCAARLAPRRAQARVWLGVALRASGTPDSQTQAEEAFAAATRLEPGDVSTWIALLWHQLQSPNPERTMRVAETMRAIAALFQSRQTALDPVDQDFLLGRCLELEGQWRLADECFRRSLRRPASAPKARPAALPPGVICSQELQPLEPVDARVLMARCSLAARQAFGLILATGADELSFEAALAWLDDDPRWSAVAHAIRGGPDNLRAATGHLARISPAEITAGDHWLWARTLELVGDDPAARQQYQILTSLGAGLPPLADWARFALRSGTESDRAAALARLESEGRASERVLQTRVRLLDAAHRRDEAIRFAQGYAQAPGEADGPDSANLSARRQRQATAAAALTAINADQQAEDLLRALAAADPAAYVPLAGWLGSRAGRLAEALSVCLSARKEPGAAERAFVAARILAQAPVPGELPTELSALFTQVLDDKDPPPEFLSALAVLRESEGDVPAALRLTRQVLGRNPNDVTGLNNLAWLIAAYDAEGGKALPPIERALHAAGPRPELLDTLAVALLSLGRPEEAARVLEGCVLHPAPEPNWLVHLAEAYEAAGWKKEAKRWLAAARDEGYRPQNPRDRAAIARLDRSL